MGYIGPAVVRRLRESYPGATLVGLDCGYFASCLARTGLYPELMMDSQQFADIRDVPEWLLDGVQAVVHLAGISNDPIGNAFEEMTYEINYLATIELAKKARKKGAGSFVFASSCSIYGSAEAEPRSEHSPLNPLTAYARSKILSERHLEGLAGEDFNVTSLRFSTACGMSERLRLDLVLNDFVAGAIVTGKITVLSDGTPWRPLIEVNDMARAIDWAIGRDAGDPYLAVNIGSDGWNFQVRDLAHAVADAVPGAQVFINKDAPPDKRSYRVDFGLFRNLAPRHQPLMDLSATIRGLKEGLEAMGFDDPDFRNSRFVRLNVLRKLRAEGTLTERLKWARTPVLTY